MKEQRHIIECPICQRQSARKFTILELANAAVDLQKIILEKCQTVFGVPKKQ